MPPPPRLSYGLNLASQKSAPAPKRKKAIFDSDSDEEGNGNDPTEGVEISTLGGIEDSTANPGSDRDSGRGRPAAKRKGVSLKPLSKTSIFADADDDDDGNGNGNGNDNGRKQMLPEQLNKGAGKQEYTNLSALHSSRKHAADAQDMDPSIYSYDAVYESLHAKPEKKPGGASASASASASSREGGSADGPRYMGSLLRSAEIRKRDQLRARDRLLAKEREAEGDEFAEKEKFVTAAYKAQQAELRKVEEEEVQREREEEERRRKHGGSGMVGFYRDLLSRGEEQHEAVMRAADEAARKIQETGGDAAAPEAEESAEKTAAQVAAELNARGAKIAINEEGQVVDKRQLLSAGLNVAPKPKQAAMTPADSARNVPAGSGAGVRMDSRAMGARAAGQRARQTEMIAAQLEEQARQQAETAAAQQREITERSRSQKSAGEVLSARERYLARKREREAAAKGS
ncbi:hypothetical protein ARAM_006485 [Aspergillus rambellii]|uniref:Nuclear speckle splicing regulatory protein 1 N-terminal domain-containing protein n=1 Tax=Aspergillus rambellii TaxID=308745 RepID=A0A0F8TZF3_9EURO|nr:hypothetical protein ARAM_006485 [Aspergillus rambellii]